MTEASPELSAPRHLPFLDGLRGIAALYIVCHHAWFEAIYRETDHLPPGVFRATQFLQFGQHAVDLFIVLSGFCLMLPLVRDGQLAGGLRGFVIRRARRILPAYYAALAATLLLIAAVPMMRTITGDRWDFALLELSRGTVVSHLLLVHDLSGAWMYGINPPMWSIAVEWQIYFVFALVSVPFFRCFGGLIACMFTIAMGILLSTAITVFNYASPWLLTLFGFGMLAAMLATSPGADFIRRRVNFRIVTTAAVSFYLFSVLFLPKLLSPIEMRVDLLVGAVAALVLIDCTVRQGESFIGHVASKPAAIWLGRCSYSLYLTHLPLLALGHLLMRRAGFGTSLRLVMMLAVATPIAIAFAHFFAGCFEAPFLRRRTEQADAASAPPTIPWRRAA